jgi:hypothetical protein
VVRIEEAGAMSVDLYDRTPVGGAVVACPAIRTDHVHGRATTRGVMNSRENQCGASRIAERESNLTDGRG